MKVLMDIDGVWADFVYGFTQEAYLRGKTKKVWGTEDAVEWGMPFHVAPVWKAVDETLNWWMTLKPLATPEEIAIFNRKMNYGYDRWFFVTNRAKPLGLTIEKQAELWLESIGVNTGSDSFGGVYSVQNKARWAVENGIDVAIDDKPENIELLRAMDIKTFARRWQYNAHLDGPHVESIKEFLEVYAR